VILAHTESI